MKNRSKTIITILALLGLTLSSASPLWAESNVPPDVFLADILNPNAKGTKLTGFLTIAYAGAPPAGSCSSFVINNMFVVMTLGLNNLVQPFNMDYLTAPAGVTLPDCFTNETGQIDFIKALVNTDVIPTFFNCGGTTGVTCPSWELKSITNFVASVPLQDGAFSAEIVIAVKQ